MAVQNLINVGVSSADVIMLGKLSEISLAGVSLANQITFILILIFYGLTSGCGVLTSQYWGKRDIKVIEQIMGIGMKFSLIISIVFFLIAVLIPEQVLRIFTNNADIISEGAKYLRAVSISYIFTAIAMLYLNIMRSIEKVRILTVVYATSLVVNVVANYILIFGKFGFPELGVVGAATGTVIARGVELIIVLIHNKRNKNFIQIKLKNIIHNNKILKKDFYKYSVPVILNELLWSLSVAASSTIIGRIDSSFVAANSITIVVRQFVMIFTFGIAGATGIIIGKTIGEKDLDKAMLYSRQFLQLAFLSALLAALVMLIINPFVVKFFALNAKVADYLAFMLSIAIIVIIIQSITVTLIVGTFRAGGDTKFALFADIFSAWGFSLIMAALSTFYFKWHPKITFLFLMSDEPIKLPLILWRYKTKKWLKNVTRDDIDDFSDKKEV